MRAIDELTPTSQNLRWTEVGRRVGLEDKRVLDLLGAIASTFEIDPTKFKGKIKAGRGDKFVKDAIKYYEDQLVDA